MGDLEARVAELERRLAIMEIDRDYSMTRSLTGAVLVGVFLLSVIILSMLVHTALRAWGLV
jgi:predicted lysophospholipase L1 biosynthesis ABC-type transport system permease subunit